MDLINLKQLIKWNKVCIDNKIFHVSTKVSSIVLFCCSVIVTMRQYGGNPIDCIVEGFAKSVMNTYCWFYSTYTLSNRLIGVPGKDLLIPGVASGPKSDDTLKYHTYYQWVCFALFFQALFSYSPRYYWKSYENGRVKMLSEEINQPLPKDDVKDERKLIVIEYFKKNLNRHSEYAYRYFFCELLSFAISIAQIYITDAFLGGEFLNYGIDMMLGQSIDPMTRIFPKITKCQFYSYGPSGSIQRYDGLCVLAQNILNEKIYLFLWFWFASVIILSVIGLIYRILICWSGKLRICQLKMQARMASPNDIESIMKHFDIGDWFLFSLFNKNCDSFIIKEICEDLALKL